jgi:hypothetical protein
MKTYGHLNNTKIRVVWIVAPCSLVEVLTFRQNLLLTSSGFLEEMMATFYQTIRLHILEYNDHHIPHRVNPKSHVLTTCLHF